MATTHDIDQFDTDVAIVGYGPVGQALAALLGRAGHRVVVFERFQEIYRLPRAVHLDHEIMRLLQSLGLTDALARELVPVDDYQWFGADGELLLRFDVDGLARSGWGSDYMFFQPELEAAIHRHACVPAGVAMERGWVADGIEDSGDHVELTVHRVSVHGAGQLARTGERRRVREPDPVAGTIGVQGLVKHAGTQGRFDDVVGRGFQLIVAGGDPLEHLSDRQRALLDTLEVTVASLDQAAPHGISDCDGRLTDWLSEHNAHAVLVRPDFYVFGGAASPEAVPALLDDVRTQLHITPTPTTAGALT